MPDQSNVEKTAHDKAKALTDEIAGQMTTLENKYHHREITFDRYIEMGEFYSKANTEAIESLIASEKLALLDKLEESRYSIQMTPDPNSDTDIIFLSDIKAIRATLTQEKNK